MSTPEQPETPALTRKQLRDIRNTGATPIVSVEDHDTPVEDLVNVEEPLDVSADHIEQTDAADFDELDDDIEGTYVVAPGQPIAAHLPRAAVPAVVHDLPGTDASVDLGVAPLTRRQARQQELIRTASVPVITSEAAAAHAAAAAPAADQQPQSVELEQVDAILVDESVIDDAATDADTHVEDAADERIVEVESGTDDDAVVHLEQIIDRPDETSPSDDTDGADRAVVNPRFGAELLAGDIEPVELPPSFDQLITRSGTGSIGTGNALILSQAPSEAPLVAPVTATGEVLITGSFNLPEGLGSTGHAVGTADGKEADAVLVDGELPAHSSPTPIAASAAISTVKNGGDIIKPPAPEKGGRLMLTLAITAGVLALALVGVLILAFVTGVF